MPNGEEGRPLLHSRDDLSRFLQRYGVKERTGQDLAPNIVPIVVVDDARHLVPELQQPRVVVGGLAIPGGVGTFSGVEVRAGGRGCWVDGGGIANTGTGWLVLPNTPLTAGLVTVPLAGYNLVGATSRVRVGNVALTAPQQQNAYRGEPFTTPFGATFVFVPAGSSLTITEAAAQTAAQCRISFWEVPLG